MSQQENNSNTKFTREYESEFSRQIWKYDLSITKNGPVSVTIHNKDNKDWKPKMTLGDYAKLAKKGKLK
jgi:hypothetical protein